jgi:hypothetical protein
MRRVLLLGATLLLSGCGIPATGVIQSGDPANGVRPTALVYFIGGTDQLVPVSRDIADPVDVRTAVELLLAGPDRQDRPLGLTTALTRVPTPVISAQGTDVLLQLPPGAPPLTPIAARQLICTAAEARLSEDRDTVATGVTVVVTAPDGQRTQGTSQGCPTLAARRFATSPTAWSAVGGTSGY